MKNTLLSKLTLLLLIFIGMTSCSNHDEEITLQKVHYASKVNSCKDVLKWIPYNNPNNSEYETSSSLGLLTIESSKTQFDKKKYAISENEKLIETSVEINSLVIDETTGDIYEFSDDKIYLIDKGNYTKTLVAESEDFKTAASFIIDKKTIYLAKRKNEGKTIEIIAYNLDTNEQSILYKETRSDEKVFSTNLYYGSKNNETFLSIYSQDNQSSYIHTYSLDKNEIVWEREIGNVINSSRWLTGGEYFVDASFHTVKSYDIATGELTFEMPLDYYSYFDILDDHVILTRSGEAFRLVNLEDGRVIHQKEGRIIGNFNSIVYSVNDENQFEAYDLNSKDILFCTNLNEIEESNDHFNWDLSPLSRHIVGTVNGCDIAELLVLKY